MCIFISREREESCLITDAVSVLLDGLDEGLDDGSLGDLTHWGDGVGERSGGSDGNGGSGVGKGGTGKSGVSKGGTGESGVAERGSGVGSGKTGVAQRGSDDACLGSNGQDGKNNLLWTKFTYELKKAFISVLSY